MVTIALSWAPIKVVMATTLHIMTHTSNTTATTIHYHSNTITCSHVVAKLDQEVSFKLAQVPSLFYDTAATAVCALELLCHFLYMCLHYTGEEHSVPASQGNEREGCARNVSVSFYRGNILRYAAPCANISIM